MSTFQQLDTDKQRLQGVLERCARAEMLASLDLQLMSATSLASFSTIVNTRLAELFEARAAMLVLLRGEEAPRVQLYGRDPAIGSPRLRTRLASGLAEVSRSATGQVVIASAAQVLGRVLAEEMSWTKFLIVRLVGTGGNVLGMMALVDTTASRAEDLDGLGQIGNHVTAGLENLQRAVLVTQGDRQWAEAFDSIGDFVLVHDDQQKILRVNRALAESRAKRPGELIGQSVTQLFIEVQSSSGAECPFCLTPKDVLRNEEVFDPATDKTYLISSSRLTETGEQGRKTIHVLKDVTEHREAERLYRELFDNLREGAYFSTPEGKFTEVNDALVRMLGYDSREELLAIEIPRQFYASPAQREGLSAALRRSGSMKTEEVLLRRKDGSVLHALETGFAAHDKNKKIVQFRGIVLDISEIKRVQAQLKREHDFNTQILNNTQSMILVVDTAGLVSYANRKCYEVGARGSGELVGNRLEEIVAPSQRRVLKNAFENSLEGHKVSNLQLPLVRGTRTLGEFSANLSPMRDETGSVNSVVVVMTDVTDMAGLQAKLVQTEKMAAVGQMVSGVAHEVNNPLTAILGFADLLLENSDLSSEVREELQVIMHEAQRTKEIIQNLLSFARQNPVKRGKVQINQILHRTIALRAYDCNNQGIELIERFDESLPEVEGDAHQLQQVFLNIFNNAYDAVCEVKHAREVVVETCNAGEAVEIRFRDNGPGIRQIERIFDPFFTTKEVGKGTGLGLSICYGIMREHGGDISGSNNQDGSGATFVVRLPVHTRALQMSAGMAT